MGETCEFLSNDAELAERCGGPLKPGEALLLHGTKAAVADTILQHGANEAFTTNAAFGAGVYFAENCKQSVVLSRQFQKWMNTAKRQRLSTRLAK